MSKKKKNFDKSKISYSFAKQKNSEKVQDKSDDQLIKGDINEASNQNNGNSKDFLSFSSSIEIDGEKYQVKTILE